MTCSLEYEDLDSGYSLWQPALECGHSQVLAPGSSTYNYQIIPFSLWPLWCQLLFLFESLKKNYVVEVPLATRHCHWEENHTYTPIYSDRNITSIFSPFISTYSLATVLPLSIATSWIILVHGATLHYISCLVDLFLLNEVILPLLISVISSLQLHLPRSIGLCSFPSVNFSKFNLLCH